MSTPPAALEGLPCFHELKPEQIPHLIRKLIAKHRKQIAALLSQPGPFTWDNLMAPLEEMNDELHKIWSPFTHTNAVIETEASRKAYNETLPVLTEYQTELSQSEPLFNAVKAVAESAAFATLSPAQQKIIENELRDFKLAGVNLSVEKKEIMAKLQQKSQSIIHNIFRKFIRRN